MERRERGRSRRAFLSTLAAGGIAGALAGCSTERRNQLTTTDEPGPDEDAYFETGPSVGLAEVATGLVSPNGLVTAPGDSDRRFVMDQVGKVYVHDADGLRSEPFLDLSGKLVPLGEDLPNWITFDERGLLGLAFHPDFQENGLLYVRYSKPTEAQDIDHDERLSEFRVTEDGSRVDPDSERVLFDLQWHREIHQAGSLEFGPDGYLYAALGDGLNPYNAQEIDGYQGSILRIDVDSRGEGAYGIPSDNPLVGRDGLDELYAWGFRNPWKMVFSGDRLIVGDVGQADWEEVDVVRKGGNYGWPLKEGTHCHDPTVGTSSEPCVASGSRGEELIDPVFEFPHFYQDQPIGYAVIGGHVHTGSVSPVQNQYLCGIFTRSFAEPAGRLVAATPADSAPWSTSVLQVDGSTDLDIMVLSLGQAGGETYVLGTRAPLSEEPLTKESGVIYRLTGA